MSKEKLNYILKENFTVIMAIIICLLGMVVYKIGKSPHRQFEEALPENQPKTNIEKKRETMQEESLSPETVARKFIEADMAGARLGGKIGQDASNIKIYGTMNIIGPGQTSDFLMVINKYEILDSYISEDGKLYFVKVKYFCEEGIAPNLTSTIRQNEQNVIKKFESGALLVSLSCPILFEQLCPACFQEEKTNFPFDAQNKTQTVIFTLIKEQNQWKINAPLICPHISEETFKKLLTYDL